MTVSKSTVKRPWKVPASGNVATFGAKVIKKRPLITSESGNVATPKGIDPAFVPSTEAELLACLADTQWRICSGQLYKIMIKEAGEEPGNDGTVVPFKPNRAQRKFMSRMWYRNLILKARQRGFTTLICILWLDHALFNPDQRCGIIAHNEKAAISLFRDKVQLAYANLPDFLRARFPLKQDRADELLFEHNNSSVHVATSMRSGTIHRLHVSEYGKICAKFPDKAAEVMTGSLPSVPLHGICIIESTAEGQEGDFHDKSKRAIEMAQKGVNLTQKDFRIHFSPWWDDEGYRIETDVVMTSKDNEYFEIVEGHIGKKLDRQQRNWYVATRDSEFGGDPEKMWQEYPSTYLEPFQVSTEGTYYAVQLAAARKEGRICNVPHVPGVPVNTFWDIGNSDGTAVWFHQRIGFEDRFINFIEGWGESYSYYIKQMQAMGYVWGTHYLPHDAAHKRQQGHKVASPEDELKEFAIGGDWTIVPVVDEVIHGIQKVRDAFGSMFFDAEKCALGLAHLGNYKKTWDKARGAWKIHTPSKIDGHSEAADALRQHAQGYQAPRLIEGQSKSPRNWRVS